MATISFAKSPEDTVSVRKAVLRMILSRAKSTLADPADQEKLYFFEVMEGPRFYELTDSDQRERLIDAVYRGTQLLREDIARGKEIEEPVRPDIDEKLAEIVDLFRRSR